MENWPKRKNVLELRRSTCECKRQNCGALNMVCDSCEGGKELESVRSCASDGPFV